MAPGAPLAPYPLSGFPFGDMPHVTIASFAQPTISAFPVGNHVRAAIPLVFPVAGQFSSFHALSTANLAKVQLGGCIDPIYATRATGIN